MMLNKQRNSSILAVSMYISSSMAAAEVNEYVS